MIRAIAIGLFVTLGPSFAFGSDFSLPTVAQPLADRTSTLASYDLPIAPYADGAVPSRRFEGRVQRRSWRIDGGAMTTLQVLSPLREQIETDGYKVVLECEDRGCGGFDFRFATEVIPPPDMYVDIRNYRFLSASRDPGQAITVLVSRSRSAAYVQIIEVQPEGATSGTGVARVPERAERPETDERNLADTLVAQGHVVLGDLDFKTGAASLENGSYESLRALATYLKSIPDQRIALVGHTDSSGALGVNISVSKRRAEAVKDRLVKEHGVSPNRVDAEGMGYLAPVASNLTPEGRQANRRVEAILLSDR